MRDGKYELWKGDEVTSTATTRETRPPYSVPTLVRDKLV